MAIRVGINGFGRIGRNVFRAGVNNKEIEFVGVNDLPIPLESHAYLLKHDSILGTFQGDIKVDGDSLVVNGKKLKVMTYKDPAQIPWGELGVDIVVESTKVSSMWKQSGALMSSRLIPPNVGSSNWHNLMISSGS